MTKNTNRIAWIDIAKCFSIIAVVAYHTGSDLVPDPLGWFRMPLFFLLSGFLIKIPLDQQQLLANLGKRTKQLMIPYVSFFVLILVIKLVFDRPSSGDYLGSIWYNVKLFLFGAQQLQGYFGIFWFITVLFLTYITFTVLFYFVRSHLARIIILLVAYSLAHVESWYDNNVSEIMIPWNADVVLYTLPFFALGYYGRFFYQQMNHYVWASLAFSFAIAFGAIEHFSSFRYYMGMKYLSYTSFWLDFIVPVSFALCILYVSYVISHWRFSTVFYGIGSTSVCIMYLHFPVQFVLQSIGIESALAYTVFGILFPFVAYHLFNQLFLTRFLFLGVQPGQSKVYRTEKAS